MDIGFEKDNYEFNARSSCLIKNKEHNKILLTNMRIVTDHEAYLLPGGRIEILENSEEAINRELEEELGINLKYKLISIEENIARNNKFHMIEFIYYAEIEDFNIIKKLDNGWDKFKIVEIKNIENIDIRPKTVKELIKKDSYNDITHNINYDWN